MSKGNFNKIRSFKRYLPNEWPGDCLDLEYWGVEPDTLPLPETSGCGQPEILETGPLNLHLASQPYNPWSMLPYELLWSIHLTLLLAGGRTQYSIWRHRPQPLANGGAERQTTPSDLQNQGSPQSHSSSLALAMGELDQKASQVAVW